MHLHEYQSKDLLESYNIPVPKFFVSTKATGIGKAAYELSPGPFVCKCQVHSGARGKAGGVAVLDTPQQCEAFAAKWLGNRLITKQSGPHGKIVNRILIENATKAKKEFYLGCTIDREKSAITVMASSMGGMSIEEIALSNPEAIEKVYLDYIEGAAPYKGRALALKLGLEGSSVNAFTKIFCNLVKLFVEKDLSLVEINPLALKDDGSFVCLDAKINVDPYALYRHKEFLDMDDPSQEDPRIARAVASGFSYVPLEGGEIGCLVNGAGLAMGTMDLICSMGGKPANFLDVGGTATQERVMEAFKVILEDKSVKCILVNIFGGIVRCDLIAEGILGAVRAIETKVPVVVRLEGNASHEGIEILKKSDLDITAARSLREAASFAVQKVNG